MSYHFTMARRIGILNAQLVIPGGPKKNVSNYKALLSLSFAWLDFATLPTWDPVPGDPGGEDGFDGLPGWGIGFTSLSVVSAIWNFWAS